MIYAEHLPDARLLSYVECYWVLRSAPLEPIGFRRILPDGCADIIFNFNRPLFSRSGTDTSLNSFTSFIVGNMTQPVLSKPEGSYDLFSVRFRPGGLYALMNIPVYQFTDEIASLAYYAPFDTWFEQLAEQPDTTARLRHLDALLLSHLDRSGRIAGIHYALKKISDHRGYFRVAALAKEIGMSQRQLERQFKTVVGLSPKQLARVVQFQNMVGLLKAKGEESLLQLAVDGGYSDHAHFTNSFKEFSGITPQEFLHTY